MLLRNLLSFPDDYWTPQYKELFPEALIDLLIKLNQEFEPRRQALLQARKVRQLEFDEGLFPDFLQPQSEAVAGVWTIDPLPPELLCRRVEITGPVNSAKMVINMLNRNDQGSRADMAMLDFEDSMKPIFEHILSGYKNVIEAVKGTLSFKTPEKTYQLNPTDMAYVMVRVRGLHLDESNIKIENFALSGGLLDLAVCFYHTAHLYLARGLTPKFYVPKCEHYLEARWWNDLFTVLEKSLDYPVGTLKATFLIETLPAAYQIEEILFEIRNHAAGLNVGRWDKIFSDIKVLRNHPDKVLADRSSINMTRPWMENYAKRVIHICHSRGAFAMGGMSAFTPGQTHELRTAQTEKVKQDKLREAELGHDGCWVSHPYFIDVAMRAFENKNQLHVKIPDFDKYSDLLPKSDGPHSLLGLRTNVRVGIAYMHGWNAGIGCVSFDNLMEDLATLEISRAQTWQWLHHEIKLDDGLKVTPELIEKTFDEELAAMENQFPSTELPALVKAAQDAKQIFLEKNLREFLTLASDPV